MPNMCRTCLHLTIEEENKDCENRSQCSFIEVVTVHYQTHTEIGRLIGTKTRTSQGLDKNEIVDANVYLGCESDVQSPISSPFLEHVTCLTCIANNKEII